MSALVIFITSGTTWTVPADWNSSSNTIEAIGAGGIGSGTGAGGGAYASITNFPASPGDIISIQIGTPGGTSGVGTAPTVNTWFNDGTTLVAVGGDHLGNSGGSSGFCVGTAKNSGGGDITFSGSGGGAGGPHGAGQNSGITTGGNGDAGNPTGGAGGVAGGNGGTGTTWQQSSDAAFAGPGGGGSTPGNGGNYGGGTGLGGVSGQGIIVVTYTPAAVSTPDRFPDAKGDFLPRARYVPINLRTGYAFFPGRILIAPTPADFFSSGFDPLPAIPPMPVDLRTAFVFVESALDVAPTPADQFWAGLDFLPRTPPMPVALRSSYSDASTFKVRPPAATPDRLFLAFSDLFPRPYYMPMAHRTAYTRPPNAVAVAATPAILGWISPTRNNEAVFLPKKFRSILYTSEPSWHQIPVIRRPLQRIPLFFSIPWVEYEYAVNTFINEMNFNFESLFVSTANLIPLRTATDPDRFADETNALIKQINALMVGLPNSPTRIPLFLAISTDQVTMVINELIEDVNARFITAFS